MSSPEQHAWYEGAVELTGEVRLADLDERRFVLCLADGTRVPGAFEPHQEPAIIHALREHMTRRLRVSGMARFARTSGAIERLTRVDNVAMEPPETAQDDTTVPLWEAIVALGKTIPDEELARLPKDLASNLDYYLDKSHEEE